MRHPLRRAARRVAALTLAALVAAPEIAFAVEPPTAKAVSAKQLDAMSPAELDRFVQQINESANWRKYRRPGDPPDFVPGKPVRVMNGAGAAFGRGGGRGGNARSFRQSGLGSRRGGVGSRRRGGRDEQSSMERGRGSRGSSGSSFGGSSRSRSSSGSGRSSFGSNSGFGSSSNSGFDSE